MGPLQGVRVVEMAGLAPAPFGAMILADYGAEVIQVKRSGGSGALVPPDGPLDRGKHTMTVDLKEPEGLALVHDLVAQADVFIEGFRPGVAERLGIGPEDLMRLNPRLVYGRMTGWGQEGPLAPRAGHDINYIALAGALEPIGRVGERPHAPLNLLGDFAGGGMLLALGVITALYERERSGEGQMVDAAMVDGANLLMSFVHGMHASGLWGNGRGENTLDGGAPFYDTYECSDGGFVAVGCVEPAFFSALLIALGLDESSDDVPGQLDFDRWPELRTLIGARLKAKTRDEWAEVFADSDACVTPVLSPWEAHEHPHNQQRQGFVEVGGLRQPAPAPRFGRTPNAPPQVMDEVDLASTLRDWGLGDRIPTPRTTKES
ncbi:MAG: CoA transferase [Nocardioides sp.]|nr:CoA transferase [Nocardioides sp.]